MKRAILVCETFNWAFHNICKQIERAYGDRYDIQTIAAVDSLGEVECDVVLYFWWKSAFAGRHHIIAKRTAIGLYDHWSVPQQAYRFQKAVEMADCFFVGNERLQADVKLRAPDTSVYLTEDGVDLDLFKPMPLPEEFTVGWTGNRVYEKIGLGDYKGVRLIEEACRRANVPLVIQDKQQKQLRQDEMPDGFYRKISCYVCASQYEGTPNPVLEALACGRLIVSTNVGLVPKILPGGVGWIVDRTVDSVVEGIQAARRTAEIRNTASEAIAIENWAWTEKVKAFAPVLEGE